MGTFLKRFDKWLKVACVIGMAIHTLLMMLMCSFYLWRHETALFVLNVIAWFIETYEAIDWSVVAITTGALSLVGVFASIVYFMHCADRDLKDYRGDKSTWK